MNKMKNNLLLLLFCIYLYFFYHILVTPVFADFSAFGLLLVPLLFFMFWLVPREKRRRAVVYTFLFVLLDNAIFNLYKEPRLNILLIVVAVLFLSLCLYALSRWYANIKAPAFLIALIVAIGLNTVMPDNIVAALPHLYKVWNSDRLYLGETTAYFPLVVKDIDHDGKAEVITLGNAQELDSQGQAEQKPPTYKLDNEKLYLYVWKWENGKMVRIPNNQLNQKEVAASLPKDYIGFPYYVMNNNLELEPLIQRQALAEGMAQFGTAPNRALVLNTENIRRQLDSNNGAYDIKAQVGKKYKNVVLRNGTLFGTYEGTPFRTPSPATKIVGAIQLKNGNEGLLLMGQELQLLQMKDGKMTVTNRLDRTMQPGLAQSELKIVDLFKDGRQELMIDYPFAAIFAPKDNGTWDVLWRTDDKVFRFDDVGSFTKSENEEIIAESKSAVRANPTRYLTSYHYSPEGLVQNWKILFPNLINVQFADVDGDGQNELVTTLYGQHKIFIWKKHDIPVTQVLIGLTILLVFLLVGRRLRDAKKVG